MPEPITKRLEFWEGTNFDLLADVVDNEEVLVDPSDVSSVGVTVWDLNSPNPHAIVYQKLNFSASSTNPNSSQYVTAPVTSNAAWKGSSDGYNTRVTIRTYDQEWFRSEGGHQYRIEVVVVHSTWGPIPTEWLATCKGRQSA